MLKKVENIILSLVIIVWKILKVLFSHWLVWIYNDVMLWFSDISNAIIKDN